ncbi:MAG: hypothetical protein V1656_03370 [Candidatus Jorgensenbacteria bacterium]
MDKSVLQEDAKRIAEIATKVQSAMDTLKDGKCVSAEEIIALHNALGFIVEAGRGAEAVGGFNHQHSTPFSSSCPDIHTINAARWFLAAQKHAEYRPETAHKEILEKILVWLALLQKSQYAKPLNDQEKEELEILRKFFVELESLTGRVLHGELLPVFNLEKEVKTLRKEETANVPVAQET